MLVAIFSSALAAFFYIRVIVLMFFSDTSEDGTGVEIPSLLTRSTIVVSAAITLILGVYPTPIINFISDLAIFIR